MSREGRKVKAAGTKSRAAIGWKKSIVTQSRKQRKRAQEIAHNRVNRKNTGLECSKELLAGVATMTANSKGRYWSEKYSGRGWVSDGSVLQCSVDERSFRG
jgi:hypothetical protein